MSQDGIEVPKLPIDKLKLWTNDYVGFFDRQRTGRGPESSYGAFPDECPHIEFLENGKCIEEDGRPEVGSWYKNVIFGDPARITVPVLFIGTRDVDNGPVGYTFGAWQASDGTIIWTDLERTIFEDA